MEKLNAQNSELLLDLIEINNERIASYAEAIALLDNVEDADMVSLFEKIGQQSQQFKGGLQPFVSSVSGSDNAPAASARGELFQRWTSGKINISGTDRKSVLVSCEQVEDLFRATYAHAYERSSEMDENIHSMIKSQAELQGQVHASIKELRDKS